MARHKVVTGVSALLALGLIVLAVDFGTAGNGTASSSPSTPGAPSPSGAGTTSPWKPVFPPQTVDDFRAFAATGDASQVTEIVSGKEGRQSCQAPTYYVTVSSGLAPKEVEADLSAFAVQQGLLSYVCAAFVYAFHSAADYQAHQNDGYTVGRVRVVATGGSGFQTDLEVDAGDETSGSIQATFKFTFFHSI